MTHSDIRTEDSQLWQPLCYILKLQVVELEFSERLLAVDWCGSFHGFQGSWAVQLEGGVVVFQVVCGRWAWQDMRQ